MLPCAKAYGSFFVPFFSLSQSRLSRSRPLFLPHRKCPSTAFISALSSPSKRPSPPAHSLPFTTASHRLSHPLPPPIHTHNKTPCTAVSSHAGRFIFWFIDQPLVNQRSRQQIINHIQYLFEGNHSFAHSHLQVHRRRRVKRRF